MPDIEALYEARTSLLERVRAGLQQAAMDALAGISHIDRISFRVKSASSFAGKVEQKPDAYSAPLNEVEDQIGGRVLVFFKSDVGGVVDALKTAFGAPLESAAHAPDDYAEFGYESYHEVYSIPAWSYPEGWRDRDDVPDAFELQVRTLFQHAYAEPQHDVGYKPSVELTREERRELAWIAASAWGADLQLDRLRERIQEREEH